MATTLYLRNIVPTSGWGLGFNDLALDGSTMPTWSARLASTGRGTSVQTINAGTASGPTSGIEFNSATGVYHWATDAFDSDILLGTGAVTFNMRAWESSMSANAAINVAVYRWDHTTNTRELWFRTNRTTELGYASEAAVNWTQSPSASKQFYRGDRLILVPFIDDAGTMGSGYVVSLAINGMSSGGSGDTFVTFPDTLPSFYVPGTPPSGSYLYLTDDVSDVNPGSETENVLGLSRGNTAPPGVVSYNNSSGSPPKFYGDSPSRVWFSPQLSAVTLSGTVQSHLFAIQAATTQRVAVGIELCVTDSDGTNPVPILEWTNAQMLAGGTTPSVMNMYEPIPDVSIADGQRLRLRVYITYADGYGMWADGSTQLNFDANTSLSAGDSYLQFEQTISAYNLTDKSGAATPTSNTSATTASGKKGGKGAVTNPSHASAVTAAGKKQGKGAILAAPTAVSSTSAAGHQVLAKSGAATPTSNVSGVPTATGKKGGKGAAAAASHVSGWTYTGRKQGKGAATDVSHVSGVPTATGKKGGKGAILASPTAVSGATSAGYKGGKGAATTVSHVSSTSASGSIGSNAKSGAADPTSNVSGTSAGGLKKASGAASIPSVATGATSVGKKGGKGSTTLGTFASATSAAGIHKGKGTATASHVSGTSSTGLKKGSGAASIPSVASGATAAGKKTGKGTASVTHASGWTSSGTTTRSGAATDVAHVSGAFATGSQAGVDARSGAATPTENVSGTSATGKKKGKGAADTIFHVSAASATDGKSARKGTANATHVVGLPVVGRKWTRGAAAAVGATSAVTTSGKKGGKASVTLGTFASGTSAAGRKRGKASINVVHDATTSAAGKSARKGTANATHVSSVFAVGQSLAGGVVTKNFPVSKDVTTQVNARSGSGHEWHWRIGRDGASHQYYSYADFTVDWSDVEQIVKAELVVYTDTGEDIGVGTDPQVKIVRLLSAFNEGSNGEDVFTTGNYVIPSATESGKCYGKTAKTDGGMAKIDISPIVEAWAPATVKNRAGGAGGAQAKFGVRLGYPGDFTSAYARRTTVASLQHPTSAWRPYILLTYRKKRDASQASITLLSSPLGSIPDVIGAFFTGSYIPGRENDTPVKVSIELRPAGGATSWTSTTTISANGQTTRTFSVALPGSLKSGTYYEWRARVANQQGLWTDWTSWSQFSISTAAPSLTSLTPSGTYSTLNGVYFGGKYSDPEGNPLTSFRIQMRDYLAPNDPMWDMVEGLLWDTTDVSPTLDEVKNNRIRRQYSGPGLAPGTYSLRFRVVDRLGGTSAWIYANFTLTKGWEPTPGEPDFLVGVGRRKNRFRILIKTVDTAHGRSPLSPPVAVLYDAANIGASEMYNAPGEFFFTIPSTHPQISVIEPWQVHYSLEMHRGEGWREVAGGLITDMDATEEEVVFYGIDYVGLLSLLYDSRFNPKDAIDKSVENGGSKYVNWSIGDIIADQLTRARSETNSIVGFITNGTLDPLLTDGTPTKVTIFATFKQRLSFIAGLMESHKAGTGKRTRLTVEKTSAGAYNWVVRDAPGKDRPNMRLQYGGLVQGFRIIGFGQWGTKAYGIGRGKSTEVYYDIEPAPGISEGIYGTVPQVSLWPEVVDENDLKRRTKQVARTIAKVGKRMALGLLVDGLDVKDGWDLTDNIPVDIVRGAIDTSRFGSGYWTIWGWSWQSYPDGHSDMTVSVLPREDDVAPNPDLIPSLPIHTTPEWGFGFGPPTGSADASTWYIDTSTGIIWARDKDQGTWISSGESINYPNPGTSNAAWVLRTTWGFAPQSGELTFSTNPGSQEVLALWVNKNARSGGSYANDLLALRVNDTITLKHPASNWARTLRVTTLPSDVGSYVSIIGSIVGGVGSYPADSTLLTVVLTKRSDNIDPPQPLVGLALTAELGDPALDGSHVLRLVAEVTQPAEQDSDLFATYVEVTADKEEDATYEFVPVWGNSQTIVIERTSTKGSITGVRGNTQYWARGYTLDNAGNRSAFYPTADPYPSAVTPSDESAPTIPTNFVVNGGFKALGLHWDASEAADIGTYDVRYAPDDGTGTGPDVTLWTHVQGRTSVMFIDGLTVDQKYWAQVRAVDVSGNVYREGADPPFGRIGDDGSEEWGWSGLVAGTPTNVQGADIAAFSIISNHIATAGLDADVIKTGLLTIGTTDGYADGLVIRYGGKVIGRWDEHGLFIGKDAAGLPDDLSGSDYVKVTDAGITVYLAGTPVSAITPEGINATAVNFGVLPGGHNLIANSSFELAQWGTTPTPYTWTSNTEWNPSRVGTDTNIDSTVTTELRILDVTF